MESINVVYYIMRLNEKKYDHLVNVKEIICLHSLLLSNGNSEIS